MNNFTNNNDFDRSAILKKMSEISSKIDEEHEKGGNRNLERERELMFAQMIEGLKLNTIFSRRNYF